MRIVTAAKRAAAAGLCGTLLLSAVAAPAWAASPAFSRTAEEWAALEDNNLNYDEIAALVAEYNPTVQQNQVEFQKFRKDYGDTNARVSSKYQDLASDAEDEDNYAAANSYRLQADNALEDSTVKRLGYEQTEKTLVQSAQNQMIAFWTNELTVQNDALAKRLADMDLANVRAQAAVGSATQIQVFNAEQAAQNAAKAVITDTSARDTGKAKLQVMLGWAADAEPVIGEIPELDLTRIDAMDPAEDLPKALEQNYTLLINLRELANATSETNVKTLQSTISDNEARIENSLNAAYQSVLTAKAEYLYDLANASLTRQTAEQTAQRYSLGSASQLENETAEISAEQAEIALKQSEYALFQAMEAYDWAVNGLASASAS